MDLFWYTLLAPLKKNDLLRQSVNNDMWHAWACRTTLWCLIQGANAMTFWLMVTVSGYLYVAKLSRHFCHKTAGGRMNAPATSCNNFYFGCFSVMAMLPCKNHRRFRAEAWGIVSIYGWISLISSVLVPAPCTKQSPNWIFRLWMPSMAFSDLHTLHSCEP